MPISEKLELGLLGLIVFQCFFFALFLTTQIKKEKRSNLFLALLLTVLGIHMLFNLLSAIIPFEADSKLLIGLSALYGPFIYLHIRALQLRKFPLNRKVIFHFLLAPVAIILSNFGWEPLELSMRILVLVQVYVYLILSLTSIKRYQKIITYTQSQYQRINLNWAFYMICFWILIAFVDLAGNIFSSYSLLSYDWAFTILLVAIFIFVNTLFFKGLVQPKLFLGISTNDEEIFKQENERYKDSTFTEQDILSTSNAIEKCLEYSRVYLEPELSLEQFSALLNKPPRLISQTINTTYKTNFSDFINEQRIEEAKKLLKETNGLNVSEILYEVGFNSKSAFYEHFKKKTGLTPNQFKKEQK
ncbi:MAG: AraC family transcriptional regulator [Fulvivirga sp.]|uniref:helix-turn-helix domain-containing protein n=1 Tax=Fulvivirga sp. TaxID=1931237 RepID=UPI0032EBA778